MSQPYEVRYWSKKFKVTPARLRQVVRKVGHSAKKVGAYIALQKHRARDRALISLSEAYEVRYWSKKFKVTPAAAEGGGQGRRPLLEEGRRLSRRQKEEAALGTARG